MSKDEVKEFLIAILAELSAREYQLIEREEHGDHPLASNAMWKAIATIKDYAFDAGIVITSADYDVTNVEEE